MIKRPLLAQELDSLENAKMPCLASPKLDGIRCLIVNGKAVTRAFKPIPNKVIRDYLESCGLDNVDGELITGHALDAEMFDIDDFNVIQSKVMTRDGDPGEFRFYIFDEFSDKSASYSTRLAGLPLLTIKDTSKILILETKLLVNVKELIAYETELVDDGFEGIMIRSLEGRYKEGRSTLKEGILLKYKRFEDSEAKILKLHEQLTNLGQKETNELGLTKRSKKKADLVPANTLGEFEVEDLKTGVVFHIGTGEGLTKELRQEIWNNKEQHVGKLIKYKHQGSGAKDKPRFPSFQGFRHEDDMS